MSVSYNIKSIDPKQPQSNLISDAAGIIKNGGLIVLPTTCLYGIGANAFDISALQKLYDVKQRPAEKPILILIHEVSVLLNLVQTIPDSARRIMDRFWPGGITIVFKAKDTLSSILTAGTGKIGIRLCKHPVSKALTRAVGGPVTGTSANLSGFPGCSHISDLNLGNSSSIGMVLDAGPLKGGSGSTVIDVTGSTPRILREGAVSRSELLNLL